MNWGLSLLLLTQLTGFVVLPIIAGRMERKKIIAHITARMKIVSPSLSAAQALDDLRMAVESGDYEDAA